MDVAIALKRQYRGGLAMLRNCIELFPDDLWEGGKHPRNPWRIAYHALFYTDLYLQKGPDGFQPFLSREDAKELWEQPPVVPAFTQEELLAYLDNLNERVPALVDALDLEAKESGFYWYPNFPKLDHQIMNIRHLQTHVGQLAELLNLKGIDTIWAGLREA